VTSFPGISHAFGILIEAIQSSLTKANVRY
jgi:hypothetical protein